MNDGSADGQRAPDYAGVFSNHFAIARTSPRRWVQKSERLAAGYDG